MWLHCDTSRDMVYCHTCVTARNKLKYKLEIITSNAKESAFILWWVLQLERLNKVFRYKHEASVIYKTAVDVVVTTPKLVVLEACRYRKRINKAYLKHSS